MMLQPAWSRCASCEQMQSLAELLDGIVLEDGDQTGCATNPPRGPAIGKLIGVAPNIWMSRSKAEPSHEVAGARGTLAAIREHCFLWHQETHMDGLGSQQCARLYSFVSAMQMGCVYVQILQKWS